MNQTNNELYHYGVLGMKWGHHKSNPIFSSTNKLSKKEKQVIKQEAKNKAYDKKVKDNDQRVKLYGKKQVKMADNIAIAATAYASFMSAKSIKVIGMLTMKSIAKNPNMGNIALHTASVLTATGIGAVAVSSLKNIKALNDDKTLADQYEYRQYIKKAK